MKQQFWGPARRVHIPVERYGTVPDLQLAREYGCDRSLVAKRRTTLGIVAFRPLRARGQLRGPLARMAAVLRQGTGPEVAARLGLSVGWVYRLRKRYP